jgi:hypothetical protein
VLGHSAISAGPLASTQPFAPAEVRPPSISSGGALGFGPVGAAPLSAVPTVEPPIAISAAEVVETASAVDIADAAVVPAIIVSLPGGGYRAPAHDLVVGYGYGVLPALWGEAFGTVGPAFKDDDLDELLLLLLTAA